MTTAESEAREQGHGNQGQRHGASIMSSSEIVFETEWFNIERQTYDDIEALEGKPFYRINAPDGVMVLAVTESDQLVMVEQFRPAIGQHTLELPAGARDSNETPEETAARELYEETGYVCKSLTSLGVGRLMASRLNAYQYPFLGLGAKLDSSYVAREDIKVRLVYPQELKELAVNQGFGQYAALALMVLADWKIGTSLTQPERTAQRVIRNE